MDTGTAPESSSASVFHSPQASHLPCQRLYAAPQFWQTKERVDLAIWAELAALVRARRRKMRIAMRSADSGPGPDRLQCSQAAMIYLTDTNGTAEPGTMVVGSTPFQRS